MTQQPTVDEARVRDILRVLSRIPIPRGQLVLYHLAVASPEKGFTSQEVRNILGLDQAGHRGLMAALTLRINNSPRESEPTKKGGHRLVFDTKWDGEQNTYRPQPELLAAIRRLPTLHALLAKPLADVVASPALTVALPASVDPHPLVPKAPPSIPPIIATPPAVGPFQKLVGELAAAGLVFPAELVANVVLALQVKRFVILTGISGTGKTRIAQTIAAQYVASRLEQTVGSLDDRSMALQVQPYMRKRARVVLPVQLSSQLRDTKGAGRILARWPGGEVELATYRMTAFVVLLKGEIRAWFEANMPMGATFIVRIDDVDAERPTVIFELAGAAKPVVVPNVAIVAVRPDWTDHRGLLGHYNPLTEQYVVTPFLRLLLRAGEECARAEREKRAPAPFFAVLDEMNLARVEHYFADFLSALEARTAIHLHDIVPVEEGESEDDEPVPRMLRIPPNMFFIGTVNVDESTYMFSPKVLDRAFAIELNTVDLHALAEGPETGGDLDLMKWNGRLDPPAAPQRGDWQWLTGQYDGELAGLVLDMHSALARHHRHFGYRVATEVGRFVRLSVEQSSDPEAAAWAALDIAVLEKILVKLSGTQAELQDVVQRLLEIALAGRGDHALRDLARWRLDPVADAVTGADEAEGHEPIFPRSAAKLWRMRERLLRQGFASWVE